MSHLSRKRKATLFAAAMAVLPLGEAGCGDCAGGFINVTTICADTGSADLETPDGFEIQGPPKVNGRCDGSCETVADVLFGALSETSPLGLGGSILLRGVPGRAPFTLDLGPGSAKLASVLLYSNNIPMTELTIVEGSIVVTVRTRVSFEATFSMTVQTPAGERLTIRNGKVKVSGCHGEGVCTNT